MSAMKPTKRANTEPLSTAATPIDSSAPTTMTEEMALVSDISGVCSAGVDRPDDVIADEYGQRENRQPEHERIDRPARGGLAGGRELVAIGLGGLGRIARRVCGGSEFFNCGVETVHAALRRPGAGWGEGLFRARRRG